MGNLKSLVNVSKIEDEICSHSMVVFSKRHCAYCSRAKNLLADEKIDYKLIDLSRMEEFRPKEYQGIANGLVAITNQTAVPQIFICGEFIGGYNELKSLRGMGRLHEMLSQCPMDYESSKFH